MNPHHEIPFLHFEVFVPSLQLRTSYCREQSQKIFLSDPFLLKTQAVSITLSSFVEPKLLHHWNWHIIINAVAVIFSYNYVFNCLRSIILIR